MPVFRSLEQWEAELPRIDWRQPLVVNEVYLACRTCIANEGLRGNEIPKLPTDLADFADHMREFHGVRC